MTKLTGSSQGQRPPDDVLLLRIAQGDSGALETVYDRYARLVYGLALHMLNDLEVAEDVVQETFWLVWRRSARFDVEHEPVLAWLLRMAHSLIVGELRHQHARPRRTRHQPAAAPQPHAAEHQHRDDGQAADESFHQAIVGALAQLPPEQREVIELAYFGGLAQRTIAQQLNTSVETVQTRFRLALQHLGELLHMWDMGPGHEKT